MVDKLPKLFNKLNIKDSQSTDQLHKKFDNLKISKPKSKKSACKTAIETGNFLKVKRAISLGAVCTQDDVVYAAEKGYMQKNHYYPLLFIIII